MPYDVSMQMISTEREIEEMFKKKKSFMETYGPLLGIALVCVTMIVLMSLYFDFVSKGVEQVQGTVNALQGIAQNIMGN